MLHQKTLRRESKRAQVKVYGAVDLHISNPGWFYSFHSRYQPQHVNLWGVPAPQLARSRHSLCGKDRKWRKGHRGRGQQWKKSSHLLTLVVKVKVVVVNNSYQSVSGTFYRWWNISKYSLTPNVYKLSSELYSTMWQ